MKLLDISGLTKLWNIVNNRKVDKVIGMGLTANDFSNAYKDKLDSIDIEFIDNQEIQDLWDEEIDGSEVEY